MMEGRKRMEVKDWGIRTSVKNRLKTNLFLLSLVNIVLYLDTVRAKLATYLSLDDLKPDP